MHLEKKADKINAEDIHTFQNLLRKKFQAYKAQ